MNKLAVITGGSKGIGRATVEQFAAEGFSIATCSRNQQDLQALEQEHTRKYSTDIFTCQADLSVRKDVDIFVDFVKALQRPITILINNVGSYAPGNVLDEQEGSLEKMMDANVYSAYYTTRGLAPMMLAEKSGHIINVCSVASIIAYAGGGSYAITKFALLGFTKMLREDLKKTGIRVTAVLPGPTQTSSWEGEEIPEGRLMKPEDIAQVIYSSHVISAGSVVEEVLIRPQLGDV